jgi:CRP-like cAMP-binding protein
LITEENKRTATVRVTSDTALVLRLARADIDDDLLDAMRFKTTVDIGLKFAGDMEAQLEESKEECASTYTSVPLP